MRGYRSMAPRRWCNVNKVADNLALIMFGAMFVVIFCGFPVAFVLGGMALLFAVIGWALTCLRSQASPTSS